MYQTLFISQISLHSNLRSRFAKRTFCHAAAQTQRTAVVRVSQPGPHATVRVSNPHTDTRRHRRRHSTHAHTHGHARTRTHRLTHKRDVRDKTSHRKKKPPALLSAAALISTCHCDCCLRSPRHTRSHGTIRDPIRQPPQKHSHPARRRPRPGPPAPLSPRCGHHVQQSAGTSIPAAGAARREQRRGCS